MPSSTAAPSPSPRRARCAHCGHSLLELLFAFAIAAILIHLGTPPLLEWTRAQRVRAAASEVVSAMQLARLYAVRHQANVALKFRTDDEGDVTFAIYRDADGDGVRNADIDTGVDPLVRRSRPLAHFGGGVRFGFPPGLVPRDAGSGRPMNRLDDPIRFNRTDLASFTALGQSTPGSVYLTDGRRQLAAVRVDYRVGKMRVLVYDPVEEVWHRD